MTLEEHRQWLDNWKAPAKVVPEDRPTQRRTMRKPYVNTVTCSRCLGAKVVIFHYFGEQPCPLCDGTGETDVE